MCSPFVALHYSAASAGVLPIAAAALNAGNLGGDVACSTGARRANPKRHVSACGFRR